MTTMTISKITLHLAIRWGLPILIPTAVFFLQKYIDITETYNCLASAAVVLAGFSVAAFNLRFRIIDSIQKFDLKQSQVEHLIIVFEKCRKKIDNCIILFAVTTVVLLSGKFLLSNNPNHKSNNDLITSSQIQITTSGNKEKKELSPSLKGLPFASEIALCQAMLGSSLFVICMIRFRDILLSLGILEDFSLKMIKKNSKTL